MPVIRVNRHLPVPFHEMDAAGFEAMTVALVDKEPDVISAALYRVQRQLQYGIDVLGRRRDRTIEVASCKCYKTIPKGKLKEWSDDFLNHWDEHWKEKNVRSFILVVAADVHSAERDAEVEEERKRFDALGIEYDVWAPLQIQEKLRLHPGIVVQHLGSEHLERVCGVVSAPLNVVSSAVAISSAPTADALRDLRSQISREVGHRLDHLLARFRTGEVSQTAAALDEISGGGSWNELENGTKARFLRLRASILLNAGDDNAASALADQADTLEPQTEPRLRAILAYRRDGAAAALDVLGEPSTQDGAHLQAALLLEKGDLVAAAAVLDQHPEIERDHAETLRLRALVALREDDRPTALRLAEAALVAAPEATAIMQTAAIARYASALSPAVEWDRATQAEPIPIDLVREDTVARGHLVGALELYDALSRNEMPPAERRGNKVFALACLCNLRDRSAEATAHLERMLSDDPGWAAAAYWALARGLPLDRDAMRGVLRARLAAGECDPDGVLLLAIFEAADGRPEEAIRLLETSSVFTTLEALSIRNSWLGRFRRRASRGGDATSDETEEKDVDEVIDEARGSGDWSRAEALLERIAAGSGRPSPVILPLAQALAAAARWDAVARHKDALLALETPEPIRVAVYAAIYAGEPAAALDILSRHRGAFSGGRLPSDLARLEAEALSGIGDQAGAIRTAVLLANAATSTVEDHLTAAVVHLRAGDIQAAVPFVEAARRSGNLNPHQAIQLAQAISPVDRAVASSLLREAISGPMEPTLAPGAISVAFRLGLDRQAEPLMAGLLALGDQPGSGILRFGIEDIAVFIKSKHEAAERISRMYMSGEVPVHLAADMVGANLAQIYSLHDRRVTGRGDYPIMVLHGSRSARNGTPPALGGGPMHVDITALLIADHLGLMDALERMSGRVLLPPSLPNALREMEDRLLPHQPARIAATRDVIRLATSGTIATRGGLAGQIGEPPRITDGIPQWCLDFDRDEDAPRGPEPHDGASLLNLRGMADALLKLGAIDPQQHRAALDDLGVAGRKPAVGAPTRHDRVFLVDFVVVELAAAGLLVSAAHTFRLSLDVASLREMQADIAQAEGKQILADRLSALRTRVARNLIAGTFRTLPTNGKGEEEDSGLPTRCLLELVRAPGVDGGTTWIDDRHLTAHGFCGGNRVLDTTGVMEALAQSGMITPAERWKAMLRLREAGALFVPLEAAEISHHLFAAPIVDGDLVETPALATLRRYVAKALAAATNLDIRPVRDGTGPGEVPFILSTRRVAEDSLLAIWAEGESSVEERELRSSWVWSALRVDRLPDIGLPGTSPEAWRALLVLGYAALLVNGLQLVVQVKGAARKDRLRAYMQWVGTVATHSWVSSDSEFAKEVAGTAAKVLTGLAGRDDGGKLDRDTRRALQVLLGSVVVAVPEPFHDHLLADRALCRVAGVVRNEVIELGGLRFDPSLLWKACEGALRGERTSVASADGHQTLGLRLRPGHAVGLELSGALKGGFDDPALGLLSRDRATRLRTAQDIVGELGMAPADAAAAVAEITAAKKLSDRIEAAVRIRGASVAAWRRNLQSKIESREDTAWSEFDPPDPRSLLRHVALPPGTGTSVQEALAQAAGALIRDFGISEAVRRLASLPVPLPAEVLEAVRELPEAEREHLLSEFSGVAATPLQLLHGLRIHRDLRETGTGDGEAHDKMLRSLPSMWEARAHLFLVLLRQFGEQLQPNGFIGRGLSANEAIAASWIHADHVTRAILAAGADPEVAARRFLGRPTRREVARAVLFHADYDGAAASPMTMTAEGLLFHGLGYVLGTERPHDESGLSAELLDGLRGMLTLGNEDRQMPVPWIYADREGAIDDLGSWFRARPAWLFPETVGITTEAARVSVASALRDLNVVQTARARLWFVMSIVARPHLNDEHCTLAAKALSDVDLGALADNDPEIGPMVLRCAAELAQASGDPAARSSFEEGLVRYAGRLAETREGRLLGTGDEEMVTHLVEAAAASSRSGTETEGWQRFGRLMVCLAETWPGAVPHLRDVLGSLATAAHPATSDALWDAWLKVRAMN